MPSVLREDTLFWEVCRRPASVTHLGGMKSWSFKVGDPVSRWETQTKCQPKRGGCFIHKESSPVKNPTQYVFPNFLLARCSVPRSLVSIATRVQNRWFWGVMATESEWTNTPKQGWPNRRSVPFDSVELLFHSVPANGTERNGPK